jgi:hypothetical protein
MNENTPWAVQAIIIPSRRNLSKDSELEDDMTPNLVTEQIKRG